MVDPSTINVSYWHRVFLLLMLSLPFIDLKGQTEGPVESDSIQAPSALPISEIPRLSEILGTTVQEVEDLTERPPFVDEIIAALPLTTKGIDSLYLLYTDSTRSYTYSQLDRAQVLWTNAMQKTTGWTDQVTTRIREIEAKKQEVVRQKEVASLTLKSMVEQEAPREVIGSVQDVVTELDTQIARLQDVLNKQLSLQTSITPTIAKINDGRVFVLQRRDEMRHNLWQRDTEPIWAMQPDTVNNFRHLFIEYGEDLAIAWDYVVNDSRFQFTVPVLFIILASYMWYFRRRNLSMSEEQIDKPLQIHLLVKYPILSALFITYLFVMLVIEPISEVNRLSSLLLAGPTFYLYYSLSTHYRRQQVTVFAALMAYYQVHIALETTILGRILLLLLAGGLLALSIDILRNRRQAVVPRLIQPYITFLLQIFTPLLFAAIISNLVGAMQVARLLTNGITLSLLLAALFYLSVYLLTDIASAVMTNSPLAKSNIVRKHKVYLRQKSQLLFTIGALILWLRWTTKLFGIQALVFDSIQDFVTYSVQVGTIAISLWDIIAFFLTLQISVWISKFIRFILDEEVYVRTKTEDKGVTGTISLLIRYGVISLGVVLAFAAAGIEFDKLALLLGALGVGIGFGLQSIFSNLISGIILALERPMRIGDVVEVKSLMGTVQDIGFRASIVRSFDGADVIIPNGDFLSNEFINWTRSDSRRRLEVNVGVAYGTDPDRVLELLRETAAEHEVVLKYPGPIARFLEMADSSLNFQLLYWIPDFDNSFSMGTQMTTRVYKKITEAGITIPFPQQDVYLHSKKTSEEENAE